jgi:hypothetical protein
VSPCSPFTKSKLLAFEEEFSSSITVGTDYSVFSDMKAEILCLCLLLCSYPPVVPIVPEA